VGHGKQKGGVNPCMAPKYSKHHAWTTIAYIVHKEANAHAQEKKHYSPDKTAYNIFNPYYFYSKRAGP